jgi:hypothetical protein
MRDELIIDEQEVHITVDGLGRAAIVRRSDGLFCIYVHWIWSEETRKAFRAEPGGRTTWIGDDTPLEILYGATDHGGGHQKLNPEPGLYGTLDDARHALKSLPGFSETIRAAKLS